MPCSFLKEHVLVPCQALLSDEDPHVRQQAAQFMPMLEGRLRWESDCTHVLRAHQLQVSVYCSIAGSFLSSSLLPST